MKQQWENNRRASNLAALLLLGLFALCLLTVLLCGVKAYRQLAARNVLAYDSRTISQYLSAKVQQAPMPQRVEVTDFAGGALCIGEQLDGVDYVTRVYCHEGWLMELFSAAEQEFAPEDGEKLLAVKDVTFTLKNGLLTIRFTSKNGQTRQIALSVRDGEGAIALD